MAAFYFDSEQIIMTGGKDNDDRRIEKRYGSSNEGKG